MTTLEIKRILGIPEKVADRRIPAKALRAHAPGGAKLLEMKEWLAGVANASGSDISANMARSALRRLADVEIAMLGGVERSHGMPAGTLSLHARGGLPDGRRREAALTPWARRVAGMLAEEWGCSAAEAIERALRDASRRELILIEAEEALLPPEGN